MFGILFLLFTVIPALELYLLFKIGAQIGLAQTLFIIISTGFIGANLVKSQGLKILMEIQNELGRGGVPSNAILKGLLMLVGGVLMITPGFITDVIGILLVLPITQDIIGLFLKPLLFKMLKSNKVNVFYSARGGFPGAQQGNPFEQNPYEAHPQDQNINDTSDVFEAQYEKRD